MLPAHRRVATGAVRGLSSRLVLNLPALSLLEVVTGLATATTDRNNPDPTGPTQAVVAIAQEVVTVPDNHHQERVDLSLIPEVLVAPKDVLARPVLPVLQVRLPNTHSASNIRHVAMYSTGIVNELLTLTSTGPPGSPGYYDPGYGYPYPVDVPVYVPVIPDYGYLPPPNYGYYPPDYYNDPDDFDDWSPPYVSVD